MLVTVQRNCDLSKKFANTFSKNWVYENALDFHSWFENYMGVTIKKLGIKATCMKVDKGLRKHI